MTSPTSKFLFNAAYVGEMSSNADACSILQGIFKCAKSLYKMRQNPSVQNGKTFNFKDCLSKFIMLQVINTHYDLTD